MKDELNNYGILNSDGVAQPAENEGKVSFDNDKPDFIRESATADLGETSRVSETFDDPKESSSEDDEPRDYSQQDLSSSTSSSASSSASASASTASAASASVGGGLGALAGVVATSVMAAVVVVAVFVSTLVINLSLVLANMYSLTFEVTMTGADEKDFEQPIVAVLTGEDFYREQQVTADTVLLTFDDLEPGKEYRLTVKNEEKVFAEVTAFTTTEPNEKGEIISHMQGTDVSVMVTKAELKSGEYYTLIAKDAEGNVVFSKDGVDPFVEYTFRVDEPKDLSFFLMVNGKAYAISQTFVPSYDFDNGAWTWSEDLASATVTFADTRGGEALVLTASVTRKKTDPTCEKDGSLVYTAKAEYAGKTYTGKKTTVLDALGHDYDGVYEAGQITYTCSRCHDSYTSD